MLVGLLLKVKNLDQPLYLLIVCNVCSANNDILHTKDQILYINLVSLSICPGRYILNPCEQGVVFVFNVPSWTCLFVCLCGQKLGSAWKILSVTARSL